MKKKVFLIILVFAGLYSCITPKYFVIKQSEMKSLDLDKSLINYIPLEDELLVNSAVLDSSYKLLSAKKYTKLDIYIKKLEASEANSSDFYLAQALSHISNSYYLEAMQSLEMVKDDKYKLLKRLLSIDLSYEMERMDSHFDFKIYLQKYQYLIDSYPNNKELKKIIAIRLRYLRYNY